MTPGSGLAALKALSRLRRIETDLARRALAAAVAREIELTGQDAALARQFSEARTVEFDFDREALGAWFARVRTIRARLADAMREAQARTAAERTALMQRRLAETSAQAALTQALAIHEAAAARQAQYALEDAARAAGRVAQMRTR